MEKKLAFFDIDGTMVNVANGLLHPTEETIRVLHEFQQQGNYIVVATARGRIPESVEAINFDGKICSDGHYIEFHDEVLVDNLFSVEELAMQIELYDAHQAEYLFGGHYGSWASHPHGELIEALDMTFGSGGQGKKARTIEAINQIRANSATPLFHNVTDLHACLEQLPKEWAITAYDKGLSRMDVHLSGFEKGTACVYLLEHLKINPANAYAFGDGENDIEMLKLIKHSIAMGNAAEHIKAIASDITATVDDEGIAKAFKKHFNI